MSVFIKKAICALSFVIFFGKYPLKRFHFSVKYCKIERTAYGRIIPYALRLKNKHSGDIFNYGTD